MTLATYESKVDFTPARQRKVTTMTLTFTVETEQDFIKLYEVAAWWTKIRVPAGDYEARPMTINFRPCELASAYWVCVSLPGVISDEYMPSLFGGVAYGAAKREGRIGQPENASMQLYGYQVREAVATGDQCWNLDVGIEEPDYDARERTY